jgi:hypothetical protein
LVIRLIEAVPRGKIIALVEAFTGHFTDHHARSCRARCWTCPLSRDWCGITMWDARGLPNARWAVTGAAAYL